MSIVSRKRVKTFTRTFCMALLLFLYKIEDGEGGLLNKFGSVQWQIKRRGPGGAAPPSLLGPFG